MSANKCFRMADSAECHSRQGSSADQRAERAMSTRATRQGSSGGGAP